MKKILKIIMLCWLCVTVPVQGQEVTFISSAVEEGIRQHLQINEGEYISFAQLDTITSIDLSKRNITDIHDLLLLPNLRNLDLSNNMVENLHPLTMLDSLECVDLSFNKLKTINELAFSNSKKMTVNVAFNYIGDFVFFGLMTPCNFVLEGTTFQMREDAPYFDVWKLYCDATVSPAVIHAAVRTNMSEPAQLLCEESEMAVSTNATGFSQTLQNEPMETVPVYLNNGVWGDSTYYVPQATHDVQPNQTLTIATSLPDNYAIRVCLSPKQGTLEVDGTNLVYTASDSFVSDDIVFAYYWGPFLKGFSQYHLGNGTIVLGDVNGDGDVSLIDILMCVDYILDKTPEGFIFANADMDNNGEISLADILAIVDIILNQTSASIPATARESSLDALALTAKGNSCTLHLDNSEPCRGISFTVTLPEGGTMGNLTVPASRADGHQALINTVIPGRYNVIVYANNGKPLRDGTTAMLRFDISGCQAEDITISDIQMVNGWNETVILPATYGITTGIAEVDSDSNDGQLWYNTVGIGSKKPTRGVNIHNGKKTEVK